MSPLFELSDTALTFVMMIGAITAFFMALIATVQFDIKRVVAYSTLSQLGYMTMALGASAYSAAIFHLFTHAFFKAVLFLGAGSVIIALHHEQDMRKMGGLAKYMPITYLTMLIGALANAGLPPFAGFFSKDTIIEALHASPLPGSGIAYVLAVAGVLVGGFYSFRLIFYTFHGKARFADPNDPAVKACDAERAAEKAAAQDAHAHDDHHHAHDAHDTHHDSHHAKPHESPWVVTVPLILLAAAAVCAGWLIGDFVFGSHFGNSIVVAPEHSAIATLKQQFHGVVPMIMHGFATLPFWLAVTGAAIAFYIYIVAPGLPVVLRAWWGRAVTVLMDKYGFDRFNDWFFAGGARKLGIGLWRGGDVAVIDGVMVNGTANAVGWLSTVIRKIQSGYIYNYAFAMIFGIVLLLTLTLWSLMP
jgi:NADH-quinone oxidoreductase subunit L